MKQIGIDTGERIKPFNVDETILNGLYYTGDKRKVNANIKNFNIKRENAKGFNDLGIKFSKNGDKVIVTFNFKQPNINFYGQFLVCAEAEPLDILNSENPILMSFKTILMDATDLAKVTTLEEALELKRIFNKPS